MNILHTHVSVPSVFHWITLVLLALCFLLMLVAEVGFVKKHPSTHKFSIYAILASWTIAAGSGVYLMHYPIHEGLFFAAWSDLPHWSQIVICDLTFGYFVTVVIWYIVDLKVRTWLECRNFVTEVAVTAALLFVGHTVAQWLLPFGHNLSAQAGLLCYSLFVPYVLFRALNKWHKWLDSRINHLAFS